MFGQDAGKPVTVVVAEHTFIEGRPVKKGTVLKDVPPELAMELASGGKVRAPTADDLAKAGGKSAAEASQ
jgi:hypothetical protein